MGRRRIGFQPPRHPSRSGEHVRELTGGELGLRTPKQKALPNQPERLAWDIPDDDPCLIRVLSLFQDGFGGVILSGPPGTSKTWYAEQIAAKLVGGEAERARFLQFHPSYQYEDFVEGYVPEKAGRFKLQDKHLLIMCKAARRLAPKLCVLVIDELSRCDPSRVFGEALTYLEMRKREQKFKLASGTELSMPMNLRFLATMNPLDRGVDEVDAAMERRFAKIEMKPDEAKLAQFLSRNRMDEGLAGRVIAFFRYLQKTQNPECRVGHSYFINARDEATLRRLWDHQLRFYLEKALRLNPQDVEDIERHWEAIFLVQGPEPK